jgi:hypothetical protein
MVTATFISAPAGFERSTGTCTVPHCNSAGRSAGHGVVVNTGGGAGAVVVGAAVVVAAADVVVAASVVAVVVAMVAGAADGSDAAEPFVPLPHAARRISAAAPRADRGERTCCIV